MLNWLTKTQQIANWEILGFIIIFMLLIGTFNVMLNEIDKLLIVLRDYKNLLKK